MTVVPGFIALATLLANSGLRRKRDAMSSASMPRPLLVTRIHRPASRPGASRLIFPLLPSSRVHLTAQSATASYFHGGAPDRLTIAIDINGAVSRADYHRHWTFSAALRIPVIIILRQRAKHSRSEICRGQ